MCHTQNCYLTFLLRTRSELNHEVTSCLANLKKLNQPDPPYVEVTGSSSVRVMWNRVSASCGFQVTYKLMCGMIWFDTCGRLVCCTVFISEEYTPPHIMI